MPKRDSRLSEDQIQEIKSLSLEIEGRGNELAAMYTRYKEIYFMTNIETPRNPSVDKDDWKITASPNGRNAVTGMKRLLDTSELQITVKSRGDKAPYSDRIEAGLKRILAVSNEFRRTDIEKDANLSAVLFGPVVLAAEAVDDMLKVHKKPIYKKRLEQVLRRTPFLLRAVSPEQSFQEWGEIGLTDHVRKYQLKGNVLKERWGVEDVSSNNEYTVHDYIGLEPRLVWVEGIAEPIMAKKHGMETMNIAARYAGGSSLFGRLEEQLQPFLYAHAKGEWDRRENLFYTYLFTALFQQGVPGPLLIVDPDSVNGQTELDIDFRGGIRKIFAKATPANFPVVDADAMQIRQIFTELSGQSMIHGQTLGENIKGSTFSGLAMLSSAGQLPLTDPKEAVAKAFKDIFTHILCRIKAEGIENELISPAWIPDDYPDIEVRLEPKLPQDNLRNSQIAQGLGDLVSDEWKHENLLQISDTKAMMRQSLKEQMVKAIFAAIAQDPMRMQQLIAAAMGEPPPPAAPPGMPMGAASPNQAPPPEGAMPPAPSPEQAMGTTPPEGAMLQQGQPNVQGPPQTGPMVPPQERI